MTVSFHMVNILDRAKTSFHLAEIEDAQKNTAQIWLCCSVYQKSGHFVITTYIFVFV